MYFSECLLSFLSSVVGLNVLSTLHLNATNFNSVELSIKPTAQVNSPFELTRHDSVTETCLSLHRWVCDTFVWRCVIGISKTLVVL